MDGRCVNSYDTSTEAMDMVLKSAAPRVSLPEVGKERGFFYESQKGCLHFSEKKKAIDWLFLSYIISVMSWFSQHKGNHIFYTLSD